MSQGVRIDPPKDDRVQRALADPDRYFAEARRRANDEVRAEMERERQRGARRRNPRS